ncbi:glutaredoxin 3 [Gigaspora margarita]|uniref:Glutaredoxin 3 n=1 Tax=Gigaspora margarita TaxID=4874 RepID=A0A8H4A185_GIGMA|nr:glutaredoxin 3 [Gigaspora margarita]
MFRRSKNILNIFYLTIATTIVLFLFSSQIYDIIMSDEIKSQVEEAIAKNHIMVFSKSYCPYCNRAKQTLDELKVKYQALELDTMEDGPAIQNYLAEKTNQKTVPSIFIGQKHIGGREIILFMIS